MQSRKIVFSALAVLVIGVGWYLFRPERLWVNKAVNESLDQATARPAAVMPSDAGAGSATPNAPPSALLQGMFHSGAHETRGTATVYEVEGGKRVLRLTGFETSNGPDVQVYLVAAPDAKDNATVTRAGFVRLGDLKGNQGDQNYELPDGVDLAKYRAVTIWCRRFGVNFGTAPLAPSRS